MHGLEHFTDRVRAPEAPGEYCFPPMAACITGAARLMLALLEGEVAKLDGAYAFCDTDSMAIVSTERGGLTPCPGGRHRLRDGREAIRALSWGQVDGIRGKFEQLNPYDQSLVPGSVLELEDENFTTRKRTMRRQLYCYSISAKRYALYAQDQRGRVILSPPTKRKPGEKWSEHGLGHLLNPLDPDDDDRDWIRRLWHYELQHSLGQETSRPAWLRGPAIGRITVSKPFAREAFRTLNQDRPFAEQIKPFNFLLSAHVGFNGYPADADPHHFQLVAPWEHDPRRWLAMPWINKYSPGGETYPVATRQPADADTVQVQTYASTLGEYRVHPEPKSLAPNGKPAGWHGDGLLARRPVVVGRIVHIGKESNELDDIQAGTVHDLAEVVNEHVREDAWRRYVLPVLQSMARSELRRAGLSGTSIGRIKSGSFGGTPRTRGKLADVAAEVAQRELHRAGMTPPADPVDCCAALASRQANDRRG